MGNVVVGMVTENLLITPPPPYSQWDQTRTSRQSMS
uniref:Uncharacterized protein n=1 Tax=Anguilla anguilla TaxID=7936 RepID=A0A0E9U4B1_ANGAN